MTYRGLFLLSVTHLFVQAEPERDLMPKGGMNGTKELPLDSKCSLFLFDFGDLAAETGPHRHVSVCDVGLRARWKPLDLFVSAIITNPIKLEYEIFSSC